MYCEISLTHTFFDADKYHSFLKEIEIVALVSKADGLAESRVYNSRPATVQRGIVDAARVDGLLVLFLLYGDSSTWYIEGSLNDNSVLFETAKKMAEGILKKRKRFKANKLTVDRLRFFEEGFQKIKIVGKAMGWKEAWKDTKERQNLIPTTVQSLLTGGLLYLILGTQWVNSNEPVKLSVALVASLASILIRIPLFYLTQKSKIVYVYGED